MALHEKKQLLRDMYAQLTPDPNPADPTTTPSTDPSMPPNPDTPASPHLPAPIPQPLDNRIEKYLRPLATFILFLPFLLGLAAIAWLLATYWNAGTNLHAGLNISHIIRDSFRLGGITVFIILLGLAAAFAFREILPPKRRWIAFSFLMALVPFAIAAIPLMPVCYYKGRNAGFHRLNFHTLTLDARDIRDAFPPPAPTTILSFAPFDPEYAKLPYYTREVLKPNRIYIHDRGITLQLEDSLPLSPTSDEGLAIPLYPESPTAAHKHADDNHYELLSESPPVYRITDHSLELHEFLPPGSPPPPSATFPRWR